MKHYTALLAICFTAAARAQENPLSIEAKVYTGFYSTSTKSDAKQSVKFVPLGARFDITGFLLSPDLVTYSVQPEIAAGPQASDAGIQGGDGVRLHLTFLRKRAFPFTFRYSNVQIQDVYFGGLTQVSGYRLQNRNKELGATWEIRPNKELTIILDGSTGSVHSKSDLAQVPDYVSKQDHINLDANYSRGGWDLQGFGHHQTQDSNILMPIHGEGVAGQLVQSVDQAQGSARRTLLRDSEFYVDAGNQSTSTQLLQFPINLTTKYGTASLRLFQRRRWKTSFRTRYSSNLASQLLTQSVASLAGPTAILPLAGTTQTPDTVLAPFTHGVSLLNMNAMTSAEIKSGFGVFGTVERNEVLANGRNTPLNSSYFLMTGGVNYSHKFNWGTLSGQYGRDLGYGSVTGQTGTIQGQSYRLSALHVTSSDVSFEVSLHGADQWVKNAQPLSNESVAVDGSVGFRAVRSINARFGGGWQQSNFVNAGSEFNTHGYTGRVSLDHPRCQFTVHLNDALANSLPFYNPLLAGGIATAGLLPLQVIPSSYHSLGYSLHATPLRKLEFSGSYTRSLQRLDGVLNNNFELLNLSALYHFRKLQLEFGYVRFSQVFTLYPNLDRSRLYVRLQRTARIR